MFKRYLLFAGATYYPSGGWDDFVGSFDTTEQAKDALLAKGFDYYDWAHIVDATDGAVVWAGKGPR